MSQEAAWLRADLRKLMKDSVLQHFPEAYAGPADLQAVRSPAGRRKRLAQRYLSLRSF
jgi:hypothetical protein